MMPATNLRAVSLLMTGKLDPQSADTQDTPSQKNKHVEVTNIGIGHAAQEVTQRYGTAGAEYIKAYRGVDNATGEVFSKGLKSISQGKVNPDYAQQNIKQQAGNSAEVAATAHDNADAIINGSKIRMRRTDDMQQYGHNHPVVDRVQVLNGEIISGTETQMKFVGKPNTLMRNIAREDGKLARYRDTKIELPSEQVDGAKAYCMKRAEVYRKNADAADKDGHPIAADKLRREAENFEKLADDIEDAGLTTEEALFYRLHPELATFRDLVVVSHKAGMQSAKIGAVIGGCISLVTNSIAVFNGDKKAVDGLTDTAQDTVKAAAVGYGTGFAGSMIKSTLEQAKSKTLHNMGNTSLPALVVSTCLNVSGSVMRYAKGEIRETQLMVEVGETGAGMLSSSMMAAVGQIAIPIPLVGAMIGGMVGYTLSSIFYESAVQASKDLDESADRWRAAKLMEETARAQIAIESTAFQAFMAKELPQLHAETESLFLAVEAVAGLGIDEFAVAINQYATLFGARLEFASLSEFDTFMASDEPLRL